MNVRRATPSDFLAVAALDRQAWRDNRHAEFIPDGEHGWRVWVEHALVFCAEQDGRILGAVEAHPCMNGTWCLHKVFVDPSCRGRGIGSKLIEALLETIDDLQVDLFLTVDPAIQAALDLYQRWGFTDRRFVPVYYRDNEDRYVLTRPG